MAPFCNFNFKSIKPLMHLAIVSSVLFSTTPFAQETNISASQKSIEAASQEIYKGLVTSQRKEMLELINSSIYYESNNLNKYNEELALICKNINYLYCPSVNFFAKKVVSVGMMYPTGVMVLNETFMKNANPEETIFILAHELAHNYLNHHKKYAQIFAQKIEEMKELNKEPLSNTTPPNNVNNSNSANSAEEENSTASTSGIIPLIIMRPAMTLLEDEADNFAFTYLVQQKIKFNCPAFFSRLEAPNFQSSHSSFTQRCENYEKILKLQ